MKRRSPTFWLLGIVVVLCVVIGLWIRDFNSSMQAFRMRNQVYQEVRSPDGRYVATLAYSDGLTFGYYFVCLQPSANWHRLQPDDPIPHDEVTEVAAEGLGPITWKGKSKLVIGYDSSSSDKAQFVLQKSTWRDVDIVYDGV